MQVFKTKAFARWAKKERISDKALLNSVAEISNGLVDACLGAYIYKKRVAQQGQGKRGSWRTVLAFKAKEKAFYILGYSKNEKTNLTEHELVALKKLAKDIMAYTENDIQSLLKHKELIEVKDHGKK